MTKRMPMGLSAHLGYLFLELSLRERFEAARSAGFDAVEHPRPFELTPDETVRLLADNGLSFAQMAGGVGDPSKGEKGLAALPGREKDFLSGFRRSVDYAEAIGCPFVHPMAGVPAKEADPKRILATYRTNMDAARDTVRDRPVRILVEAISHAAVPGYYMSTLSQVLALSSQYSPGTVSVLVDTFHARANGEDATAFIERYPSLIGHVHIADHPGRHEPGTGSFDFEPFLRQLQKSAYAGSIGFEYVPMGKTAAGLNWVSSWRRLAGRPSTLTATQQEIP